MNGRVVGEERFYSDHASSVVRRYPWVKDLLDQFSLPVYGEEGAE
jgi:hypothetical protein